MKRLLPLILCIIISCSKSSDKKQVKNTFIISVTIENQTDNNSAYSVFNPEKDGYLYNGGSYGSNYPVCFISDFTTYSRASFTSVPFPNIKMDLKNVATQDNIGFVSIISNSGSVSSYNANIHFQIEKNNGTELDGSFSLTGTDTLKHESFSASGTFTNMEIMQ